MSTVIVHFDEDGELLYHVCGDNVRLFIVDERSPNDRVYEWLSRQPEPDVAAIIGDGPIGSKDDSRHAAIEAKIVALVEGRKPFSLVDGGKE
jgi:hypothetical protein